MFGPEYPKINTAFQRDPRKVVVPGLWSMPEFEYLQDRPWRWTEKVDGTNIRLHWNGERVTVGGRTDQAQVPTFLLAVLLAVLGANGTLEPALWESIFPEADDVTVYGEGYGPKIQSGGQYRSDVALIVFDVQVGRWWLKDDAVEDIASKLQLEVVPALGIWNLKSAISAVENEKVSSTWPGARLEGMVGRPTVDLFDRRGDRIIVKIKGKDFADLRRRGSS